MDNQCTNGSNCHSPCLVMFFPKNNHMTAPMESLMMATSPLFSATLTIGHPHWNYIGPLLDFIPYSNTTNKPAFLSLPLPTSTMHYSTAAQPEPHHAPHTFHVLGQHIVHAPDLEVMGLGRHKDLRGFESASFGTLWSTSLFFICSFYYHMLFTITPYMFMFCFSINTPLSNLLLLNSLSSS